MNTIPVGSPIAVLAIDAPAGRCLAPTLWALAGDAVNTVPVGSPIAVLAIDAPAERCLAPALWALAGDAVNTVPVGSPIAVLAIDAPAERCLAPALWALVLAVEGCGTWGLVRARVGRCPSKRAFSSGVGGQ